MSIEPIDIPSLQVLTSVVLAHCAAEMTIEERSNFMSAAMGAVYPHVLRERIVTQLARQGSLTSEELAKAVSGGICSLDLSEAQTETFDSSMLDLVWAGERGITSLHIDSTPLTPCLYRMLIYAHVMRPVNASQLIELSISYCEELSDPILDAVCETFVNLRILKIPFCDSLTGEALSSISRACFSQSLTVLDYSYNAAPATGLQCLDGLCALRSLVASHLKEVEDFSAPSFSSLRLLDVSGMSRVASATMCALIAPSIGTVIELSLTESSISASDLNAVSSKLIRPLLLRKLNLSWCEDLSAESMAAFAIMCPDLITLSLQSTKMDSAGIQRIAKCCKNISVLNLSRCVDIDNEAMICLGCNCQLRSLDISWAPVGSEGVLNLLEKSILLNVLCLQGCKTIDQLVMDIFMGNVAGGMYMPLALKFLDLSWVNICSEQHAKSISKTWPGIFVVGMQFIGAMLPI